MILKIRAVAGCSRSAVKQEGASFKVYLNKPARGGEANNQLIKLLAEYLKVKRYRLKIVRGERSRDKLVQLDEDI